MAAEAADGDAAAQEAVAAALAVLSQGRCAVVVDPGRQDGLSGCSLAMAAECATAERLAFMIRHSTGLIFACLDRDRLEAFGLVPTSGGGGESAYTSVDFAQGTSSGASPKDRAATLRALCDTSNLPSAFSRPGHTFPRCVGKDGVLERANRAEAVYDLCRLAKLAAVGAMAELMQDDGEAFTVEAARKFSEDYGIPFVTADQLRSFRCSSEGPVEVRNHAPPVRDAESQMWIEDVEADCSIMFYSTSSDIEIVAIVKGDLKGQEGVPARVHSECFTGDVIGSKRCDCGQQLHKFLQIMNTEPRGVLLYIKGHEGRGIGLANKIRAYHLQDSGVDTVDANLQLGLPVDTRTYDDSLFVLQDLGVKSIRLFTNNPLKVGALAKIVKDVAALPSVENERNRAYLQTKRERMNHRTVLETFKLPPPVLDVAKAVIGVVFTTWNEYYVKELVAAAEARLQHEGVRSTKLAVPGACELISGARAVIRQAKPDAVIVIGVLIRGSSDIYDATCNAVMTGLTELNASQDTPIVMGLLMCQNEGQAHDRSLGPSNPAKAWAETALHMASLSAISTQAGGSGTRSVAWAEQPR